MRSSTAKNVVPRSSKRNRIAAQLVTFFAITYLIAWAAWIPVIRYPKLPAQLAFIGLFAPAFAALVTTAIFGGIRSGGDMVRRLRVPFQLRWGVFSIVIMPAIYLSATAAVKLLKPGGTWPRFVGNSPLFVLTAFVWLLFVNSGEELGWRGFALPRLLESSRNPVLASLALGVIWGVWHLPLYLLPGQSAFPFSLFLIFTALQSVLYTGIFIRTKGSLVPAILLHAGTDIAPRVLQLTQLPAAFWIGVDLTLGLVVMAFLPGIDRAINSARQTQTPANTTRDERAPWPR